VRVLFVNAFHYLRGGVERTYFDETRWLAAAGHEVAHFAIQDSRNLPSPTERFFAPAADVGEGAPLGRQLRHLPHVLWSRPAAGAMRRLLDAFRPDVAHIHAPSRYLTPSVLRPLEDARVPMVMTLHDFKRWCTNRVLFAHGAPCERCRGGAHWHAAAVGCVQGSHLKSALAGVEAYLHDLLGAYRGVRLWIAPSRFVLDKAVELGLPADTLRLLRHGVELSRPDPPQAAGAGPRDADPESLAPPARAPLAIPQRRYVLFAGRLSVEKGVTLLPRIAAAIGDTPLLVAGEGPLFADMERAAASQRNIRLLGHLTGGDLAAMRANAAVVVVPSLFYETYCYAVAEAQLDGRTVVASRIGAIPELIEHEVTGLLAPPGDGEAIAGAVQRALEDPAAAAWAAAGRRGIEDAAAPAAHVAGLTAIYEQARAR
jgi:glycosyltransferase involved in cell wall biosynthesis